MNGIRICRNKSSNAGGIRKHFENKLAKRKNLMGFAYAEINQAMLEKSENILITIKKANKRVHI